jgi:hypothetical protein
MWMQLRAWWYLRFARTVPLDDQGATGAKMPSDVREYVIRSSIKPAIDKTKTDEAKKKPSALFWDQAMSGLLSAALSDELIAASFKVLDRVPFPPLPTAPPMSKRYPQSVIGRMPAPCSKCGGLVVLMDIPNGHFYCCDACGDFEKAGS